jgi:hypothetical protein
VPVEAARRHTPKVNPQIGYDHVCSAGTDDCRSGLIARFIRFVQHIFAFMLNERQHMLTADIAAQDDEIHVEATRSCKCLLENKRGPMEIGNMQYIH